MGSQFGAAFEHDSQTVAFFVSVILVNLLLQYVLDPSRTLHPPNRLSRLRYRDGKSNYMEGLMLVALYLVIGMACT